MYDSQMVEPMRQELKDVGFLEMKTVAEVDSYLGNGDKTSLVVVNSVCGCAAGAARPGVREAVKSDVLPDQLLTVFAGQDADATNKARAYFHGYSPSSPSIALIKDSQVVFMMERMDIEGKSAGAIADELKFAFQRHCQNIDENTTVEKLLSSFPGYEKKLKALLGSDSGPIGNNTELIEKIEDLLDEEPEPIPLEFTVEGAERFREMLVQERKEGHGIALTQSGMDFQMEAKADDYEYESQGLKIFVPKSSIKSYSGRKIHFAMGPQGGGFSLV